MGIGTGSHRRRRSITHCRLEDRRRVRLWPCCARRLCGSGLRSRRHSGQSDRTHRHWPIVGRPEILQGTSVSGPARGFADLLGRAIVTKGLRLNDVAGRFADRGMRSSKRRGFEWTLDRLERRPPELLPRGAVAPVGLFEDFVLHEDVRRANPVDQPRVVPEELADVVRGFSATTGGSYGRCDLSLARPPVSMRRGLDQM